MRGFSIHKKLFLSVLSLFIILIQFTVANAGPRQITYKDYLKDSANNPYNGSYYVEFRIYNLSTGGTQEFCELQSINFDNGNIFAHIGAGTTGGIPDAVFLPPGDDYLEVKVGTGATGTTCPYTFTSSRVFTRIELDAAAYVYHAKKSDSSDTCTTCSNANLLDGYDSIDFSSAVHTHNYDSTYVNEGQTNSITTTMIVDGTVGAADLGINVVGSVDGVTPATKGGNIDLIAGSGITITPNDVADTITIAATATGGDITGVTAGTGLSGGGLSGDVTLSLGSTYQLPQACTSGQITEWSGTGWACAADDNTLGGLSCTSGQVAKWSGTAWACSADADSGGDITGVTASTGLTGGATSGNATLSLATSYSLPQACTSGQLPQWNSTSSTWTCVSSSSVADTKCDALGTCAVVYGGSQLTGMMTSGNGVTGTTTSTLDLQGGVYGFTRSTGINVAGVVGDNKGTGYGVLGTTSSSTLGVAAVRGENFGVGYGVLGETSSTNAESAGIFGANLGQGHGFQGYTRSTLSTAAAINAWNEGPGYGIITASATGIGMKVTGNSGLGTAIEAVGDIRASGHIYAHTTTHIGDIAEPVLTAPDVDQGDVVIINSLDGTFDNLIFIKSASPYDKRVAGIISTNPSMLLANDKDRLPLAVNGIVPVKVDATYGEIQAGDLLTSSPVSGHAMKVSDHTKAHGAIIGKALESLKEGQGKIMVLVTLQ